MLKITSQNFMQNKKQNPEPGAQGLFFYLVNVLSENLNANISTFDCVKLS